MFQPISMVISMQFFIVFLSILTFIYQFNVQSTLHTAHIITISFHFIFGNFFFFFVYFAGIENEIIDGNSITCILKNMRMNGKKRSNHNQYIYFFGNLRRKRKIKRITKNGEFKTKKRTKQVIEQRERDRFKTRRRRCKRKNRAIYILYWFGGKIK